MAAPPAAANYLPPAGRVRIVPEGQGAVEKIQKSPLYTSRVIQNSLQDAATSSTLENFMKAIMEKTDKQEKMLQQLKESKERGGDEESREGRKSRRDGDKKARRQ